MIRTLKIVRDSTGSQCRSQGKVDWDVLVSFSSSDKECSSVLNSLKFIQFLFWGTIKNTITVVYS